jgi:hypothetical protein
MEKKEKLNLNQEILTIDGKPIPYNQLGNLTLKIAIKTAILNAEMDKKTPEQKYDAYKMAMKVESENIDFKKEEWVTIKHAIGVVYYPEIVGFIWDAIEKI